MFVYYFALVDRPLAEVEHGLKEMFGSIDGWAQEAYREGEDLAERFRLGSPVGVAKTVEAKLLPVVSTADVVTMKLSWEATGTPGLFPKLDGDLIAARLSDRLTQLSLRGSYSPPFGVVGRVLDKAVMHRLAEFSVKQLVDRVAQELRNQVSASSQETP